MASINRPLTAFTRSVRSSRLYSTATNKPRHFLSIANLTPSEFSILVNNALSHGPPCNLSTIISTIIDDLPLQPTHASCGHFPHINRKRQWSGSKSDVIGSPAHPCRPFGKAPTALDIDNDAGTGRPQWARARYSQRVPQLCYPLLDPPPCRCYVCPSGVERRQSSLYGSRTGRSAGSIQCRASHF